MIPQAPNTRRNRIAALIAIALGLGVGFYFTVSEGEKEQASDVAVVTEVSELPKQPNRPQSLRLEDIDFQSYSKDLAKFTGLAEGQSRIEAIDNVRLYFAPEEGDNIIHTRQSSFEREDGAVFIFGASGLPDDSVKAEEIYLILTGPKGSQTLGAYGAKIMCHRGSNTTEWQTKPCP